MREIVGRSSRAYPAAGAPVFFVHNPGICDGDNVFIKDDDHRLVRAGAICIGEERG